ncbi:MAG: hypothetical protein HY287_05900 [Planctomycetes bacterium]|nr:hypothetical protein [Planctomycetota bacterium]MBI3833845.1 hypothetical protein [Planctomycetota bacterium]
MSHHNHAVLRLSFLLAVAGYFCLPAQWSFAAGPPTKPTAERLVTGDAERIGNVVAGTGATLKFYFTPRPALPGTDPTLVYPSGATIVGQLLTVSGGGFTSAWISQIEGWDPDGNGDVLVRAFQDKIDGQGFLGANAAPSNPGCDLTYPASSSFPCQKTCAGGMNNGNPCFTNSNCPGGTCADPCPSILGEAGPTCGGLVSGVCDWAWQDINRPDWVDPGVTPPPIICVDCYWPGPSGPAFDYATNPGQEIHDGGSRYYIGSVVLPVPACCKGVYTIGHKFDETFAQDQAQPANDIPVAALVAGQLNCQVGSCCTATQCIDNLTAAECTSAGGSPFVAGGHCLNPPTTDGCCDCVGPGPAGDAECEYNGPNHCLVGHCVGCNCELLPRFGWNQQTQCCDAGTGNVTTKAVPDGPCVRGCSLPGSYGVPQVVYTPSGTACDTGAQCIDYEQCNAVGQCLGTPTTAGTPCTLAGGPDPCISSASCDGQSHCIAEEYLGPECLKNRYITFSPLDVGGISALRVTLNSLQHPQPPNFPQFPPQNFSAFEGQVRWVGPPQDCDETESPSTTFKCAFLQCTPVYADWSSLLNGNWLHVTGAEVMPSSAYTFDQLNASCQGNEQSCADIAKSAQVTTARWGDCVSAYQLASPPLTQPNITDITAIINKFKGVPGAISRTRAQLVPNSIAVVQHISIADVAAGVDTFIALEYVQPGPQQCP